MTGDITEEDAVSAPPARRVLGGLAVLAYFFLWSRWAGAADVAYGRVFRDLTGLAGVIPVMLLIFILGPAIGFRKNAWVLVFVPVVGAFFMGGAIYRTAILPYRPWAGTTIPYRWTRGWTIAPAVGLLLAIAFFGSDMAKQDWPIRTGVHRAIENEVDKVDGDVFGRRARLLMVFDRGERAVALVEVREPNSNPEPTPWWFVKERRLGIQSWKRDENSTYLNSTISFPRGHLRCSSAAPSFCVAKLPPAATGFEVAFDSGAVGTGVARKGWGVTFVRPGTQVKTFRAFDQDGKVLEDYNAAQT